MRRELLASVSLRPCWRWTVSIGMSLANLSAIYDPDRGFLYETTQDVWVLA